MTAAPIMVLTDLGVSRETFERLSRLVALLTRWNSAINLVSKGSISEAWQRHVLDSAQIYRLADVPVGHWADFGSGAGFPGLVVAIIAAELDPAMRVTLVEADQRKAAFLIQVCRELGLDSVKVIDQRIERIVALGADVVSARALGALDLLLEYAHRHLAAGGIGLFPKGPGFRQEIEAANRRWSYAVEAIPSQTASAAVILKVKDLVNA